MPKAYEAMRDKFAKENRAKGMPPKQAYDAAQSKAAAIYNARHKGAPVRGNSRGK